MNAKVSVIIPVYNAEKYIASCIESLLSQTLQECEFIFINDGSSDHSGQVIKRYQGSDRRILLIEQDNQGVSAARNAGLERAAGEYIGFVDADDYIEKDMYETLYSAAKHDDCDVVISNFENELEGHKRITRYPFPRDTVLHRNYIEQEVMLYFLKSENLNTACNKIYRNEIIRSCNIKFPNRVALGEDGMFNMRFFSHASVMQYIDYTGYHYREVAGSATRNMAGKDYFKRALEVYTSDLPECYSGSVSTATIQKLKSIQLIKSVLSNAHVYFSPSNEASFSQRYDYVKQMIRHPYVREALPDYYHEIYSTLGRYEKFIANMIRRKSTVGLYCAATYSRLRNKKLGGA